MDNSVIETIILTIKEVIYDFSTYLSTNLSSNLLDANITIYNITITLKDFIVTGLSIALFTFAFIFIIKIFMFGTKWLRGLIW